jgi:hypothetical protein
VPEIHGIVHVHEEVDVSEPTSMVGRHYLGRFDWRGYISTLVQSFAYCGDHSKRKGQYHYGLQTKAEDGMKRWYS